MKENELKINLEIKKKIEVKIKVIQKTDNDFLGNYKGSEIEISRENPNCFYIRVYDENGYSYDGYWEEEKSGITPIEEAIKESLIGSQLVFIN